MKAGHTLYFGVRRRRIYYSLIAILCLVVLVFCCGCATTYAKKGSDADGRSRARTMEETWGIRVKNVRFSAGGNLIDVRYKVTDAEKASVLLVKKENKPYLINETTGAVLSIPDVDKIGALRSSTKNLTAGKEYFIMFANPVMLVKKGDKVAIVIGDFKAEHLNVQ